MAQKNKSGVGADASPEAPGCPQTRSAQQIEQIPVSDLIPYARNARTHSEQQVGQIAGSIQEFGFNVPVLIDGQNSIIAGHGRVLAAQRLKLDTVPCIRLTHLTDAQRRAYILADNRIALNSGWDEAMLQVELAELHADEVDLGLLGFEAGELEKLLNLMPTDDALPDSSAKEINPDEFSMQAKCPRCQFEFDSKA
jgi:ParB-like chromosome segregation protein Spo0J